MERAVAIKKLGKLLGKHLAYRVDPGGYTAEEREAARVAWGEARQKASALQLQKEARVNALLDADPEYQQLKTAYDAARKERERLSGMIHRCKFTVGTTNGMFFVVKAEGDSWEEVIAKVQS